MRKLHNLLLFVPTGTFQPIVPGRISEFRITVSYTYIIMNDENYDEKNKNHIATVAAHYL
jgi:hypothetical protein